MKHIKLFENKSYKFTKVDFTGGGDGVYALYIDNKLFKYGDYYHDKIEEWVDAFIQGARWNGASIQYSTLECTDSSMIEEISELAGTPPQNLSDITLLDEDI